MVVHAPGGFQKVPNFFAGNLIQQAQCGLLAHSNISTNAEMVGAHLRQPKGPHGRKPNFLSLEMEISIIVLLRPHRACLQPFRAEEKGSPV